jgi:GNAT superfamily N-acetyltransferase
MHSVTVSRLETTIKDVAASWMAGLETETMSVTVRLGSLSDAPDVVRLTAQLGYDVEAAAVSARLSRILERTDQRFFIAELARQPVGWLHAAIWEYLETDAFVVVGGLVVDRKHRKHGIGRALMAHAEESAVLRGCSIVRLWSSSARTDAHQFYARLGYVNVKTQYSFAKSVDPARRDELKKLVPRIKD